jgi:hypothetical protein
MSRRLVLAIAVAAFAVTASLASAHSAKPKLARTLAKGDLVVIFSGAGGGSYRYHEPASGAGSACRSADTTYSEADSYRWYYRFVLPPGGGASDVAAAVAGGGEISGTEQLLQCAGLAALTSTCTETLRTPPAVNASDLAYPNVVVGAAGGLVTVGALGELITTSPQATCTGVGVLAPNPVQGFSQLQAAVSIDRATLAATGGVTRHFTMAGSGLYGGLALSGSCNSGGCDVGDCSDSGGAGSGPPTSCSFNESYSGTIEVRIVR